MKSETLQLRQGTAEWHAHRAQHFNASDAAAMMGMSKYKTRAELLREKATGIIPEVDAATQARFDRGHQIEALARPFAEALIGDELFPVVLSAEVDGLPMSASLDGLTMTEDVAWECKSMNAELAESLDHGNIPISYWPQMEQGLMLSGAERCVFMASDGTEEGTLYAWYESRSELRKQILSGWKQFAADLAAYRPEDDVIPAQAPVATSHEYLPSVTIQAAGSLSIRDNLSQFGDALTAYLGRMPKKPESDQDFADLEDAVKRLKAAEEALDAAENGALAQASSIDDMRRQVERWRALARDNRLAFEKLVKSEKENRKAALVGAARDDLQQHLLKLNQAVGNHMPAIVGDWAGVIKGLKTLSSIKDKLDGELARAKVEANQIADTIQENRRYLIADGQDWAFLFPDFRQCCTKAPEDFANLLMHRINEHKQREAAKLEAERERIRREESERITREAARADLQTKAQAAQEAREAEQRGKTTEATHAQSNATDAPQAPAASTPQIDDGKRLKLGELKAILAPISIDADGLAQLGIHPAGTEKAAKLYRAADVPAICRAIIGHLNAVIAGQ